MLTAAWMVAVVALRLRGRRLRMHWRHEQLSIGMAVESAHHHSVQAAASSAD